jgi:hypothetical protein
LDEGRRISAFNFFVKERVAQLRLENPGMEHQECMKQVGEHWRQLTKEQRASWCFDPPAKATLAKATQRSRTRGSAKDAQSSDSISSPLSFSDSVASPPRSSRVVAGDANHMRNMRDMQDISILFPENAHSQKRPRLGHALAGGQDGELFGGSAWRQNPAMHSLHSSFDPSFPVHMDRGLSEWFGPMSLIQQLPVSLFVTHTHV